MTNETRTIEERNKILIQIACKASYPIFGNLSESLQNRLQRIAGKNFYNPEVAAAISMASNVVGYPFIAYSFGIDPGFGLICGLCEGIARLTFDGSCLPYDRLPVNASGLGKLVSLPIEAGLGFMMHWKKKLDVKIEGKSQN